MTAKHKAAIRKGIKAAAKQRMHWTKTAKGRKHMKKMGLLRGKLMKQIKAQKALKTAVNINNNLGEETSDQPRISFHAAYLLGKIETLIEFYATSKGIPPAPLASELGELLRHSESR